MVREIFFPDGDEPFPQIPKKIKIRDSSLSLEKIGEQKDAIRYDRSVGSLRTFCEGRNIASMEDLLPLGTHLSTVYQHDATPRENPIPIGDKTYSYTSTSFNRTTPDGRRFSMTRSTEYVSVLEIGMEDGRERIIRSVGIPLAEMTKWDDAAEDEEPQSPPSFHGTDTTITDPLTGRNRDYLFFVGDQVAPEIVQEYTDFARDLIRAVLPGS